MNTNERDEITASVAAHAELGPRYDDAVAEGLVERIGAEIDRRIDARLGAGPRPGAPGARPGPAPTARLPETERLAPAYQGPSEPAPATPFAVPAPPRRAGGLSGALLGLGSLGMGLGATGIVLAHTRNAAADVVIILLIWAAIAVINIAHSQRR